jgi:hypothetical protein
MLKAVDPKKLKPSCSMSPLQTRPSAFDRSALQRQSEKAVDS